MKTQTPTKIIRYSHCLACLKAYELLSLQIAQGSKNKKAERAIYRAFWRNMNYLLHNCTDIFLQSIIRKK